MKENKAEGEDGFVTVHRIQTVIDTLEDTHENDTIENLEDERGMAEDLSPDIPLSVLHAGPADGEHLFGENKLK